eukprot:c25119_g1_i2 orf=307-2619(+)
MAEDLGPAFDDFAPPVRADNKRKFDSGDQERRTGFSAAPGENRVSYKSVPSSPLTGFELARQRAEEIAARLVAQDAKRASTDENAGEHASGNFVSNCSDHDREQRSYPEHNQGQLFQEQSHLTQLDEDRIVEQGNYNMQGLPQSKKIDIPNHRVGLVIGKGGETIKYLQQQSGARIQVTRDSDHDPNVQARQVELMGTPEQINSAEQLINDVIAEAAAGGSGALIGHGFGGGGPPGEQVQINVPSSKIGLIIGRGGETIRSLQSRSGARIQLAESEPGSFERGLILIGGRKQTDLAHDLIKEVINMSENRYRGPHIQGGYSQQGIRPRGPPRWGPPNVPSVQQQGYGYRQQGSYTGPHQQHPGNQQYSRPTAQYASNPPPSTGFTSGWDQKPPAPAQQPQQAEPYDYSQQNQAGNVPMGYGQLESSGSVQQPYGQQGMQQQSYNQPTPDQHAHTQGFGQDQSSRQAGSTDQSYTQPVPPHTGYEHTHVQQSMPSTAYNQQELGQHAYVQQGISQQGHGHEVPHPGYQQGTFEQGYVQQVPPPSYGQQGSIQSGLGNQGSAQPECGQQGSGQHRFGQQGNGQQNYGLQGPGQQNYGLQGTGQQNYGQQVTSHQSYEQQIHSQPGYSQQESVHPGYGQHAPSQHVYGQQAGSQSGYGQQTVAQSPFMDQGSAQQALGSPQAYVQPGSNQQGYVQQGPANGQQVVMQAPYGQPVYSDVRGYNQSQQITQVPRQQGYAHQIHYSSTSDTLGNAGATGVDPASKFSVAASQAQGG